MLDADCRIMNYGNLLAGGKLIGLKIFITNLTKFEQIIELSVDSQSFRYSRLELMKDYPIDDSEQLPFSMKDDNSNYIKNSEYMHECWYIENPNSKELTKKITLKLSPKAVPDFIIVIRSPLKIKKPENLVSLINIGLLTYKGE